MLDQSWRESKGTSQIFYPYTTDWVLCPFYLSSVHLVHLDCNLFQARYCLLWYDCRVHSTMRPPLMNNNSVFSKMLSMSSLFSEFIFFGKCHYTSKFKGATAGVRQNFLKYFFLIFWQAWEPVEFFALNVTHTVKVWVTPKQEFSGSNPHLFLNRLTIVLI